MRRCFTLLLSFALAIFAWAQPADPGFDPNRDIGLRLEKGAVVVSAPAGVHLKASFMAVAKKDGPGILQAGPLPPTTEKDELGDGIWHGLVRIPLKGQGLVGSVRLEVTFQPCTEGEGGVCFPPTTRMLVAKASEIPVGKPEGTIAPAPEVSGAPAVVAPVPTTVGVPAPPSTGLLLSLLLVFLAGMGASLTPCVYPMIPITMAIVGAKGGGRAKGFALSAALVLGMATTYTALGVLAARSGAAFGAFAQKPAFLWPVSLLFAAFALSLFGAFEIALPPSLAMKLQGDGSRKGFRGAFLMGLVLGPLSAPCVGPIVGAVLVDIAQRADVLVGGLKLFVFALGMGVLFLVVGTFSAALPRSGDWLTRFKRIMGLVVLGFAVWNVRLVAPSSLILGLWALVALIGAVVIGVFESADTFPGQVRRGFAVLCLLVAGLLGLRALEGALDLALLPRGGADRVAVASSEWMTQDFEGALAKAKSEGKLVLVDVYADWCAQCKELDEKTWPDPEIRTWIAQHAIALRLDTDAKRPDLAARLQIRSYPTVLLLDAEGRELQRVLGFQKPEAMKGWLRAKP